MAHVIIKESSYDYARLRNDVFDILAQMDSDIISSGSKVLIKPNLLAPAPPEKAVTTHPLINKVSG